MIQIRTLGAVELSRDGTSVRSVLSQPKRLALLLHLAAAAAGGHLPRARLLALFWPESDDERARNALRQALHYLRRSLGEGVLSVGGEREVGVDPGAVWCDAVAFRDALRNGRLEEALALYGGDFLPGFFVDDAPDVERWIDEERTALRALAVGAATALAERAEAAGEVALAAQHARRAVSLDPLGEAGVRRLMRLLAASGERASALETYRDFERTLAQQLELEPSPETTALAAAIRSGAHTVVGAGAPLATERRAPPPRAAPAGREQPAPSPAPPPTATAVRGWGRRARPAAVVATAVVLAVGVWNGRSLFAPPPLPDGPPSIAVLPFVNMSGDPENDYFSDGLAEELLNVLARVPGLKVAARTSSFAFRGKDVAIDSIGRALGVTHVIEGSVRASGRARRVRVTAQLIEAERGFHLWSETYDRDADAILEVQEEISRAIAQKLQVELAGNVSGASVRETADPEAYRLLLRAQHALRTPTPESFARAALLLEDAIRRDPAYARAHGALASTLAWQGERGWAPREDAFARAEALAQRSLRLGETPEAHLALARLAEMNAWAPDSADAHFRRALTLNPADARTLQHRALFLARSGRADEAAASAVLATELDPLHAGSWTNYGVVLFTLDRYQEAVAALEQARRIAPEDPIVLSNLANFYAHAGRLEDAVATMARVLELNPDDVDARGLRIHLLFRGGRTAEASAALTELERNQAVPRVVLAFLHAHTQDIERILDLLEESARRREPDLIRIRAPDTFRGMRHHPRFVALLETLERN